METEKQKKIVQQESGVRSQESGVRIKIKYTLFIPQTNHPYTISL
ncbi:hypothetical protein [Sphaerospermopsis sp. FACHB-1194]|nr:hypothetical protein [Sphaerospermopsis sp. FACHB-1194]